MSEAQKEKIKLTASWLNIMAAGTMVTGVIAPLFSLVYDFENMNAALVWRIPIGSAVLFFTSFVLHYGGNRILERLDCV
ncbi:putative diguanylate cyclase [Roseibium sp. TrichSKD4]|uniref:hypothetical protein n=1 Tax=Roseibium sp. TrichSKD4 TaxID=744980 RepID=UPI0001E57540|nr:hypothetical protein [Roseibium sp. TrichSKD4]EFO29351.1 putative diguanylate cyclase [Roseibium sp. TrichSKD4]